MQSRWSLQGAGKALASCPGSTGCNQPPCPRGQPPFPFTPAVPQARVPMCACTGTRHMCGAACTWLCLLPGSPRCLQLDWGGAHPLGCSQPQTPACSIRGWLGRVGLSLLSLTAAASARGSDPALWLEHPLPGRPSCWIPHPSCISAFTAPALCRLHIIAAISSPGKPESESSLEADSASYVGFQAWLITLCQSSQGSQPAPPFDLPRFKQFPTECGHGQDPADHWGAAEAGDGVSRT